VKLKGDWSAPGGKGGKRDEGFLQNLGVNKKGKKERASWCMREVVKPTIGLHKGLNVLPFASLLRERGKDILAFMWRFLFTLVGPGCPETGQEAKISLGHLLENGVVGK